MRRTRGETVNSGMHWTQSQVPALYRKDRLRIGSAGLLKSCAGGATRGKRRMR